MLIYIPRYNRELELTENRIKCVVGKTAELDCSEDPSQSWHALCSGDLGCPGSTSKGLLP